MYSDSDTACAVGCPIRKSRDQRVLASPPGLSQRATSFIASQCQGIHQMPLLRLILTYLNFATCRGKPHISRSPEDTSASVRANRRSGRGSVTEPLVYNHI